MMGGPAPLTQTCMVNPLIKFDMSFNSVTNSIIFKAPLPPRLFSCRHGRHVSGFYQVTLFDTLL